jgi:N-acetylneuraminic acid mutarotase
VRSPAIKASMLAVAVLSACGDDSSQPPPAVDAQVSCPPAGPWGAAPSVLLGATQETAAVAVDGKVYVVGGFNTASGILAAIQIYDTASCTWSAGPALPVAVHHANLAAVDGALYVLGALEGSNFAAIGKVWTWTPGQGDAWTELAPMPPGSFRGSAVTGVIDGTIYLAGGLRGSRAVADVSSFDPRTGIWTTDLAPLPRPRDHACGGVVDGVLYVVGGREGAVEAVARNTYAYTPGGGWADRAAMPTARGGAACGVLADRIVVVGGEGNRSAPSGVFAEAEELTPAADTWRVLPPMPTPRHGMAAAAWEGRIYVPGGAVVDGFAATDTHDVLTP